MANLAIAADMIDSWVLTAPPQVIWDHTYQSSFSLSELADCHQDKQCGKAMHYLFFWLPTGLNQQLPACSHHAVVLHKARSVDDC